MSVTSADGPRPHMRMRNQRGCLRCTQRKTGTHAQTAAKELLQQADKYRLGSGVDRFSYGTVGSV
jgi:hypothetical protein